ncbi:MAG: hypothetical protein PHC53_05435 [Patescibacteria group bacterium]|nr:hypothetical protein [Patescibacteria group bacterium]
MTEAILLTLQKRLPYERFKHTVYTMHAMDLAAKVYGLNVEQASLAGLCHDFAWAMPIDQMVSTLNRYESLLLSQLTGPQRRNSTFLHGPVSAWVAVEYGVNEEAVFLAIREHSGCFAEMTLLSRCLRVVDLTVALPVSDKRRDQMFRHLMTGGLDTVEKMIAKHNLGRSSAPPKLPSNQPSTTPPA